MVVIFAKFLQIFKLLGMLWLS